MNQSNSLSVHLKRSESIAGWIYLPFYLFFLSLILGIVLAALGYDILDAGIQAKTNLAYGVINFIAVCLIFRRFLIQNLSHVFHHFWGYLQAVILGFVMYWVGTMLVGVLVNWLHPGIANMNNNAVESMAGSNYRAMLLYTVALAPIVEETLFRGLVFSTLHRRTRIGAYAVSILFFGAIHVVGFLGTVPWVDLLLNFLQYVPAGIALGWAYERADSIWAPITMHLIINAIAMLSL